MLLAERGFVTLAFDVSHQGESEGQPRYIEIPSERVEDIRSAVDYLTTLPQVDANKIGVRHFTEEDLESIYIIECLKNCNMSIQEIKDFT